MKPILFFLLFILAFSSSCFSYQYVIDKTGIMFYDTELSRPSWGKPSSFRMRELKIKPFPIQDPRGGKGIVKRVYVDPLVPFSYYIVQTYDFSPRKWSYFIKIERNFVHIYYPRIYKLETASDSSN